MRAAEILSQEIALGKIDIGAAIGIESMTNTPYYLYGARKGYRLGAGEQIVDGLMKGGLICEFVGYHMGITAENIAEMYGISREETGCIRPDESPARLPCGSKTAISRRKSFPLR